jgi:hypothetical protein
MAPPAGPGKRLVEDAFSGFLFQQDFLNYSIKAVKLILGFDFAKYPRFQSENAAPFLGTPDSEASEAG